MIRNHYLNLSLLVRSEDFSLVPAEKSGFVTLGASRQSWLPTWNFSYLIKTWVLARVSYPRAKNRWLWPSRR